MVRVRGVKVNERNDLASRCGRRAINLLVAEKEGKIAVAAAAGCAAHDRARDRTAAALGIVCAP